MILVRAAPKPHIRWLEKYLGARFTRDVRAIEAIDEYGVIRGMVAYDGWTENSCIIHMAVSRPIYWRHLLGPGLEFPFVQANRGICLGLIPESNEKSCAFTRSLGFKEIARIADGHKEGVDLVLFQLRKEEWLAGTGQLRRRAA